jgi:heme A synthase
VPAHAFRRFTVIVIAVTVGVILWGAYVRASGSGAGCGSHWPTCNGQVIPRAPSVATLIELTHRITSGLAFFLILGQLVWAVRLFPRRHAARRAAMVSMALILSEALIGGGLVLFEMVAHNKSLARAAWVATHLANTFALVAALVLTRFFARGSGWQRDRSARRTTTALLAGMAGTLLVAVSGAIAALGDTLFPARSLAEGLEQDLSATAHLFVRLRVLHPLLAVVLAAYLLAVGATLVLRERAPGLRAPATALAALVLAQLAAGLLNLVLLAPIPLQLIHLLLADLVWIALSWLVARASYKSFSAFGS